SFRVDRLGDFTDRAHIRVRPREPRKRLGQQRIADEDADGFAVDDVRGLAAAPQIVIVERGKIVVDERVSVNQFEGRAGYEQRLDGTAARFGGRDGENRTNAFSTAQHGVAHRLVDDRGRGGGRGVV